jgi:hypothetical protein
MLRPDTEVRGEVTHFSSERLTSSRVSCPFASAQSWRRLWRFPQGVRFNHALFAYY